MFASNTNSVVATDAAKATAVAATAAWPEALRCTYRKGRAGAEVPARKGEDERAISSRSKSAQLTSGLDSLSDAWG